MTDSNLNENDLHGEQGFALAIHTTGEAGAGCGPLTIGIPSLDIPRTHHAPPPDRTS